MAEIKHHKKRGDFHHQRKFFWFSTKTLVVAIVPLFLLLAGVAYAKVPMIQAAIQPKPKSLTQSEKVLSAQAQSAIKGLASIQIKQEQANATLPANKVTKVSSRRIFDPVIFGIQNIITRDPADRARLQITENDRLIANLQYLLAQDKSDKNINRAVTLIKQIGKNANLNAKNPTVLADRELLTLQNGQYIRLQLILQQVEDTLPMRNYLVLEDARQKYLVVSSATLINSASSLETVFATGVKEVTKIVGDQYAELKAIEFITDFAGDVTPETRLKLLGLEKELASSFEKKMLKLPQDVRNRELQSYINYSFGDPILQVQAFEHLKDILTDREMIMGVDSLKEVAMQRLRERILQLNSPEEIDSYLNQAIQKPEDLKIFTEMQLAIDAGRDTSHKEKFAQMEPRIKERIKRLFIDANANQFQSFFTLAKDAPTDLLDVATVSNIQEMVNSSSEVSDRVKQQVLELKNQKITWFIQEVLSQNFLTRQNLAYNPVPTNADVKLLLSGPQGIAALQSLRDKVSADQQSGIDKAIQTNVGIVEEHLLTQVDNPDVFTDYEQFIKQNIGVNQALRRFGGATFTDQLNQKSQVVQKVALLEKQQLYESTQQIVQSIFLAKGTTDLEKKLPVNIQQEIKTLKQGLPARNIPQLIVPEGVTLSPIAKLPTSVEQAIVQQARERVRQEQRTTETKLDLTLTASDLGVAKPSILPDNPFYFTKKLSRRVKLLFTFSSLGRAEALVQENNEKTLEAAQLLEKSNSQKNINLALSNLEEINQNLKLLKSNADRINNLRQQHPEEVGRLVNSIIENGIARQTVFASIEDKVHGADYVRVEEIRQNVLKDGVDSLLGLTSGDTQGLVEKLAQIVNTDSGSKFKELKAIELLTEIKRSQPEEIGQILEKNEISLIQDFETKLLAMPKDEREKELLDYATGFPGNPVRQFAAYEQLKDNFTNPETLLLAEKLKDVAITNLREPIAEIVDDNTLFDFGSVVVGNRPEDLKIISEIKLRMDAPGIASPIEQKIAVIQANVEQNIIDTYKNDPAGLLASDLFSNQNGTGSISIVDVSVAKELVGLFERSPETSPEVAKVVGELEQKTISGFIENVAQGSIHSPEPTPQVIETLVELKNEVTPAVSTQIDVAISTQVETIKEYLSSETANPQVLETYLSQIENNPVIAEIVAKVGGLDFAQVLEQTATQLTQTTNQEQTLIEKTIAQIQQEIFTAPVSNPSPTEQALSEPVQQIIDQIKKEIPDKQVLETPVSTDPAITTIGQIQTAVDTTTTNTNASTVPAQEVAPATVVTPSQSTTLPGL